MLCFHHFLSFLSTYSKIVRKIKKDETFTRKLCLYQKMWQKLQISMWLAGIIIKIDNDRTIKVIVNLEVLHLIATLTHMLKSDDKITSIFNPPEKMRVLWHFYFFYVSLLSSHKSSSISFLLISISLMSLVWDEISKHWQAKFKLFGQRDQHWR